MRLRTFLAFLIVSTLATMAEAQTKISGTTQCGKPDPQYRIAVGDLPNHTFAINQSKCTWIKPLEIAGMQDKEGVSTGFDEITGNSSRTRGFFVDTMANGDKGHYRYEATVTLKDGVPQGAESRWYSVRGTGKLKGIKARGTCKGTPTPDGGMTWDCEGEYELPK